MEKIKNQSWTHKIYYAMFGTAMALLLVYYLSNTIIHFTTTHQFPINSFSRLPLTALIFPIEIFSMLFGLYFVYTLFSGNTSATASMPLKNKSETDIAILIPVFNEPDHIVKRTVEHTQNLIWPGKIRIYLLDDSDNDASRKAMDSIVETQNSTRSKKQNIGHAKIAIIRRSDRTGYKAGNINNAIKNHIEEPYFAIFDADQAPSPDFLQKTMDNFSEPSVGFAQAPQYYINDGTPLERATKIGNQIFFHAQTMSKSLDGAMPFCGTNVVVRTDAFKDINGFTYYSATEDIDLGIRMNDAGYIGIFVPEILVKGYGPSVYRAYVSQQYRWANGNLAVLKESWLRILLSKRFSLRYMMHTFFTLGWWLIGIVSLLFIVVPILSLISGTGTHHTWLPTAIIIMLYFVVGSGIGLIYVSIRSRVDGEKVRFSDAFLEYSLITNSMFIYITAAINAFLGRYIGFKRTDKSGSIGSDFRYMLPNITLAALCFILSIYALYMGMISSDFEGVRAYIPVSIWLLYYSLILSSVLLFMDWRKGVKA